MTQQMIETRRFENTEPGHHKFYEIVIVLKDGTFVVAGRWGRIGKRGVQQIKYQGVSHNGASMAANDMLRTRIAHGYHQVSKQVFRVEPIADRGISR